MCGSNLDVRTAQCAQYTKFLLKRPNKGIIIYSDAQDFRPDYLAFSRNIRYLTVFRI